MSNDPYEGAEEARRLYAKALGQDPQDDPWMVLLMVSVAVNTLAHGKHLPPDISGFPRGWQEKFRGLEAKLDEAGLLK